MSLSEEQKIAMREATYDMAFVMADDIGYIRNTLLKPDLTPSDIRRMSNVMRRLLIDNNGDLRKIAPPRIGALFLNVPDVSQFIRNNKTDQYRFFTLCGAQIFNAGLYAISVKLSAKPSNTNGVDPDRRLSVKIDGFLSQPVICFDGEWITRGDVIRYVANVASGVHSSDPKEPNHAVLNNIRYAVTVKLGGYPTVNISDQIFSQQIKSLKPDRLNMDCVLLELMVAADLLIKSPDINRLVDYVAKEDETQSYNVSMQFQKPHK